MHCPSAENMESCLVTQHQDGWDRASSVPAPCTTFRLRKAQQFGGPLPKHILQKRNDRAALPSNQVCRVTRTSRLSVKASQSIDQVNGSSLQKQKSPGRLSGLAAHLQTCQPHDTPRWTSGTVQAKSSHPRVCNTMAYLRFCC